MKPFSRTEARAAAIRWLVALGRPDADAWERVEEAQAELEFGDPVQLAIDDCLAPDTATRQARANAPLAYATEKVRSEPYAFDRVMVELAVRRKGPSGRAEALDRCIAVCEHRLGEVEDSSAELEASRAFLGLALGYRSAIHRFADREYEAGWSMSRALAHFETPRGELDTRPEAWHGEILARILELRFEHFQSSHDLAACRQTLDTIGLLLADCEMPGRAASYLWREGRYGVAAREYEHAVTMLDAAIRELPPALDHSLQFEILHQRAFAEAGLGHYDRAAHFLAQAEPLAEKWAPRQKVAERHYLLGRLAAYDGRAAEAKENLAASIRVSRKADHDQIAVESLTFLAKHGLASVPEIVHWHRSIEKRRADSRAATWRGSSPYAFDRGKAETSREKDRNEEETAK